MASELNSQPSRTTDERVATLEVMVRGVVLILGELTVALQRVVGMDAAESAKLRASVESIQADVMKSIRDEIEGKKD